LRLEVHGLEGRATIGSGTGILPVSAFGLEVGAGGITWIVRLEVHGLQGRATIGSGTGILPVSAFGL
jgi:hypothetical protein